MGASIKTTVYDSPGGAIVGAAVTSQSRDDLRPTYHVVAESVDVATTYAWTLQFLPMSSGGGADPLEGQASSAGFLAPENDNSQTCKFNVDYEGSYLLKLTVDAGLGTEEVQYVRLRALTTFGALRMVAAGERKTATSAIPVDADAEGWANDQNLNLQRLLALVRRTSTSGRVLYVDANRGRSRTYAVSDPTNILELPGPDSTALDASGIGISANGFADFSSINDAIDYATDATSRGEPAPSYSDPFVIFIQPGLYEEDLVLQAHVHLVGLGAKPAINFFDDFAGGMSILSDVESVRIKTATAGGYHVFAPASGPDTDGTYLSNLVLDNEDESSTNPTLSHTGGLLVLQDVLVRQKGNALTQGPAYKAETADLARRPALVSKNCYFLSMAETDVDRYAIIVDAANAVLSLTGGSVIGFGSGICLNESMYENTHATLREVHVACLLGYAIRGYPSLLTLSGGEVSSLGGTALSVDPFGLPPGSLPGDLAVDLFYCHIDGDVVVDVSAVTGNSALGTAGVGLDGELLFPGGSPSTLFARTIASSLNYNDSYEDPATATDAVPVAARLGVDTVQDALDKLVNLVLPLGTAPFYSLDTVYDGLATVDPVAAGSGAGRRIVADAEAVQVVAANPPVGAPVRALAGGSMDGWVQVEAGVDVGGLVSDGTGSEISLQPNPAQAGPLLSLGRTIWSEDLTTVRGLPSATILAEQKDRSTAGSYHLRLKTKDASDSLLGGLGRVIIEAGNTLNLGGTATPGSVFIQAGDYLNSSSGTGTPGEIWLTPGASARPGVEEGYVRIASPSSATGASLRAASAFVGGVSGNLYLATPNGTLSVSILDSDDLSAVIAKLTATGELEGSSVTVGPSTFLLVTTTAKGPNADVLYVGDSTSNTLNTALGDFRIGHGAIYTAGEYAASSGVRCAADGALEFEGILIVPEGLRGTPIIHTRQVQDSDTGAGVRYTVDAAASYVGVDTTSPSPGVVVIELPNSLVDGAIEGRQIIVKDEGGGCGTVGQEIQIEVGNAGPYGTIDGTTRDNLDPLILSSNFQSYTFVCAGVSGGFARWYII